MLSPQGRIAGYVVHTPDGLGRSDRLRAAELGPAQVNADAPPAELARRAGFAVTLDLDVTAEFRATCEALLRARDELAGQLRREEGEEVFEEERSRKARMLEGIEAGLLLRRLVVALQA